MKGENNELMYLTLNYNLYFRLRSAMVNSLNTYLKLKKSCGVRDILAY